MAAKRAPKVQVSLAERQRLVQRNFLTRQRSVAKEAEPTSAFAQGMVYIPCIYQQYVLGWAGYALSKILQIGGMYGAGKTSRMMYLARQFYEAGGLVYPVDLEHAMNQSLISAYMGPEYAEMFDYAVVRPEGLESGFLEIQEILTKKMKQDDPDDIVPKLILFDTIGGGSRDDSKIGDTKQVGGTSGLVTEFVNSVVPMLSGTRALLCIGNQLRDKIAIGGGPAAGNIPWYKKINMPGGHALEHDSYYLEFWKQRSVHRSKEDSVRATGHSADMVMIKNNADSPYRFYEVNVWYDGRGMDFTEPGLAWLYAGGKAGVERKKSSSYVYWSDVLGIPESSAMVDTEFWKAVNSVEVAPILHRIFGIKFPSANLYLPPSHESLVYEPWSPPVSQSVPEEDATQEEAPEPKPGRQPKRECPVPDPVPETQPE